MPIQENEKYPVLTDLINRVTNIFSEFKTSGITPLDVEVIEARKGETSLKTKIDKIDIRFDNHAVNVKDLGAKGDGVTNDTAAFVTALTIGRSVYVPTGTYVIDGITMPSNKTLYGDGKDSILKASASCQRLIEFPVKAQKITIKNLYLHGNGISKGIVTNYEYKFVGRHNISNLHFYNCTIAMDLSDIGNFYNNIDIEGSFVDTSYTEINQYGVLVNTTCTDSYFDNIRVWSCDTGIKILGSNNWSNTKVLVNNFGLVVGENGSTTKTSYNLMLTNFYAQENHQQNILINRARCMVLEGFSEGSGVSCPTGVDKNGLAICNIYLDSVRSSKIHLTSRLRSPQGKEVYGVYCTNSPMDNDISYRFMASEAITNFNPIYTLFPMLNKIFINDYDYNNGGYSYQHKGIDISRIIFNNTYCTVEIENDTTVKLNINLTSARAASKSSFNFTFKSNYVSNGTIGFVVEDTFKSKGLVMSVTGQLIKTDASSIANTPLVITNELTEKNVLIKKSLAGISNVANSSYTLFYVTVDFTNYDATATSLTVVLRNVDTRFYPF